jgi:uncharacterized protein (DUF952 family)
MSILHIALLSDWDAAVTAGTYRVSTLGASLDEVGFIHASENRDQVSRVAQFVYADETEPLVVLVLDEHEIEAAGVAVRREDGGDGELFPHIYGAIDPAWVTDVRPASFNGGAFVF